MNKTDIGKFINSLRNENGLTQKQLADMLNVTDKAVSRWETGKNYPDIEMFEKISEVFKVSVSELLEGKKIPSETLAVVSEGQVIEQIKSNKKSKRKYLIVTSAAIITSVILGIFLLRQCGVFSGIKYRKIDVFTGDAVTVMSNLEGYIAQQPKAEGEFIVDECRVFLDENRITNDLYISGTSENGRKFSVSTLYNKSNPEKSYCSVAEYKENSDPVSGITIENLRMLVSLLDLPEIKASEKYLLHIRGDLNMNQEIWLSNYEPCEKSFIFSGGILKRLNAPPPDGDYSFIELGIFHNGEVETAAEILCKID